MKSKLLHINISKPPERLAFFTRNRFFFYILALCLVAILNSSLTIIGQPYTFSKVSLEQGLSQISALSLEQDELERIWIGTGNGLNCWDGTRMRSFFPVRGDTATLIDPGILDICKHHHDFWLLSESGFTRFNVELENFRRYPFHNPNCITVYKDTVISGKAEGLFYFDNGKDRFIKYSGKLGSLNNISFLYQDNSGVLWIGLSTGQLYYYMERINELNELKLNNSSEVTSVCKDHRGHIWVGTKDNGLFIYNRDKSNISRISTNTSPLSFNNNAIRDIVEDKSNRIWVGTYTGLYVINSNRDALKLISSSDNNPHDLSHNSIFSLLLDKQGSLWIGTYFGGVNYSNISNNPIIYYSNFSSDILLSHRVIGQMIEDEKKNIWIATEGGGLNYYNRDENTIKVFGISDDSKGLSQRSVKCLHLEKDFLLLGLYRGGLNILDLKTETFKRYIPPEYDKYAPKTVWSITAYYDKYLLGTTEGIIIFDPESEEFSRFITDNKHHQKIGNNINYLLFDSFGKLWIATQNRGLISYDVENKKLEQYIKNEFDPKTIASNAIHQIYEDLHQRLWIATKGGGLSLFDRETNSFITFNKNLHNLPSDFIYGIVESRFGNLWISTSKGLSRFDVEKQQFYNYDFGSGFPLHELNYSALMLTKEGELFVGGIDGLISMNEQDLITTPPGLKLHFSSLLVNNEEIYAGDKSGILQKAIPYTNKIHLKPDHKVLTINYASNNYNLIPKNKYQYKLEGFDSDWINAEYNTSVTYTNLSPGKYSLKVRGLNAIYSPITEPIELEIVIPPPFYKTTIAFIIYAIFSLLLIGFINYFIIGRIRLTEQLRIENADKQRISELNKSKLKFFTNITHEFITPLTLVINSIEGVIENNLLSPLIKRKLYSSYNNAIRLKELAKELLEFRKIEQGFIKLRVEEKDISEFLHNIFQVFSEIAREKQISYHFHTTNNDLKIWFDPFQLEKVIMNLLSNAFKYTPEKNGAIELSLQEIDDLVIISVTDNGKGIPENELNKIFDRFFQLEDNMDLKTKGTGIGLALSESIVKAHNGRITCSSKENAGTSFAVKLKKGYNHFDKALLSEKKHEYELHPNERLISLMRNNVFKEDEISIKENSPTMLVVEDDQEMLYMVKDMFKANYHIETATNGKEGLEKAINIVPDIIISDVIMPEMSGIELCQKIKRNITTSHIPIILLSANSEEEKRIEATEAGTDEYMTKPFNTRLLNAKVENLFQTRKLLQENYKYDPQQQLKTITKSPVDRIFIEKAQEVILEHLTDPDFSVDRFAELMNQSRSLFFNKVKSIFGNTPNDLIQTIRLKKAAELLLNNEGKTISEIAYEVGFSSSRYFTQCFKNHFGTTPSKYGKVPENDIGHN